MNIVEDAKKSEQKNMMTTENANMNELYIREFKGIVLKLQSDFGFIWSRDLGRVFFHLDAINSRASPRLYLGDGVIIKVRPQEVKKDCHYRAVSVKRRKWWPENAMHIYPTHQIDGKTYDDNQIEIKVAAVVGSVWPHRAILWSDQLGRLYFPLENQSESTIAMLKPKKVFKVTCHHIRPKLDDCHWEVTAVNFTSKTIVAPIDYKMTTARLHDAWRYWEVILKEEKKGVAAAKESTFYLGLPDYHVSVQSLIDVTTVHQHFEALIAPTQIHVTTNWRAFYAHPVEYHATPDSGYSDDLSLMNAGTVTPTMTDPFLTSNISQDDTSKQVEAKFQFLEEELSQLWSESNDALAFWKPNGTWTPVSMPAASLPSPKDDAGKNYSIPPSPRSPSSPTASEASAENYYEQLKIAKQLLKEIVDDKEFFEKLCTRPQLVRRVTMFVFNNYDVKKIN